MTSMGHHRKGKEEKGRHFKNQNALMNFTFKSVEWPFHESKMPSWISLLKVWSGHFTNQNTLMDFTLKSVWSGHFTNQKCPHGFHFKKCVEWAFHESKYPHGFHF
jgi:hypothetical protein